MKTKILLIALFLSFLTSIPLSYAESKTIFVGPELAYCVGVAPQKCMMVRESPSSEWMMFYDKIKGFEFKEGYEYQLEVDVTKVANPPADASSLQYELVEVISKNQVAEDSMRHIPHDGICAPGFVPLGKICVLNDRCGPGAYPGKVCMMDGVEQPYLRPLKQGNAGIATTDVICAEPLKLVFKHDITPACINPDSVSKFESRGWHESPPSVACTLEYAPVCGVNGKTYGNVCMLESEHVAEKHKGECQDIIIPTESEIAKRYNQIQGSISSISKDIYNGMYNGVYPLDEAVAILENGKRELEEVAQEYQSLAPEQKIDRQIAMKLSTLGKMGFASIDSQISMIKNQIANPPVEKTAEQIQSEVERSLAVKFNSTANVIRDYEKSFEDSKYVGLMAAESMRESILQSQLRVFQMYDDIESNKDQISDGLYQTISSQITPLDKSMQDMWKAINSHLGTSGVPPETLQYTWQPPDIDSEKGYHVAEIADGVYWLVGNGYQTIFLTTGQGVIAIDAPQPIGDKYIAAIKDVTDEPITHMVYSHHHADHTGAAGQIFPAGINYIAHKQAADVIAAENDQNRPVPNVTFDDEMYTLSVGDKTLELHHIGNFHSKGDLVITIPKSKVAMVVDLMRPDAAPYRAFGVTPDIDLYLKTHDMLVNDFEFDVMVSGHTGILATKEHIKTNKQFALDVMNNARNAMSLEPERAIEKCVETTTSQWQGEIDGLGQFMADHCQAMKDYLSE